MKIPTVWTPRQELGLLAATVFGARNAVSLPAKDRAKLKATARPLLRAAIHSLRESRDALRAGDAERQLLLRDRAMNIA